MKKLIPFLLVLTLLSSLLVGCGPKQTTVPDAFIDAELTNIINEDENLQSLYESDYTYSTDYQITHNPDKTANIDAVTISFSFQRPAGTINYSKVRTYNYLKDSDSWNLVSNENSIFTSVELDKEKLSDAFISDSTVFKNHGNWPYISGMRSAEYTWDLTLKDIDTENETALIDYSISLTYNNGEDELNWEETEIFDADDYYPAPHALIPVNDSEFGSLRFMIPCGFETDTEVYDFYIVLRVSVDGLFATIDYYE